MEHRLSLLLTPKQVDASNLRGSTVLVACPGAGKTRIVGARASLLSAELDLSGWAGVAAITFTKAAAEEIRSVYHHIFGSDVQPPHYIGTLDSFLYRYIFNPFGHLVLGKPEQPAELVPPKSDRLDNVFRGYQYAALHGVPKDKYTYRATGEIRPVSQKPALSNAVATMKKQMKLRNLATIQDADFFALQVLRARPKVAKLIARRFPFIMVDEAQDCSDVQMAIVDELTSSGHKEIMLVGDPFQAIYQFREAEPKLLLEKTRDKKWKSYPLPDTHRCRSEIVRFINATVCEKDPARRYLRAASADVQGAVRVIDVDDPKQIGEAFIAECYAHGISAIEKDVAIIYGSHTSKMSRERVQRDQIEKLFQTLNREHHAALAVATQQVLLGKPADALKKATELFCWLLYNKSTHEVQRQRIGMERLHTLTPGIWKFCKNLPDAGLVLSEWIAWSNRKLDAFLREHRIDRGFQMHLSAQVGDKKEIPLKTLLVGESDYATGLPVTVANVHQMKGRTFKAVLVYLEKGEQKMLSSGNLMKLLSGKKPFAKMSEYDRCLYVAITRGEQLLCFAGDVAELKKYLDELQRFPIAQTRSLFDQ